VCTCKYCLLRWPSPAGVARLTAFDLSIRSLFSAAALRLASVDAAVVLGETVKLKAARALEMVGAACHPLVMSSNGRMSPMMLAFVKELARRLARSREVSVGEERTWLVQRISVALQRANGMALANVGGRLRDALRAVMGQVGQ